MAEVSRFFDSPLLFQIFPLFKIFLSQNSKFSPIIGKYFDSQKFQFRQPRILTEAAKEIKGLLDELDKEYNNPALVGAKAIEKIENNPSLKARFVNALKEGGTETLNQLINHPACSIVLAAGKGFLDAQ